MIIVRLLSPGPWLVCTTKVHSGVGADIVMESISLIESVLSEIADFNSYEGNVPTASNLMSTSIET